MIQRILKELKEIHIPEIDFIFKSEQVYNERRNLDIKRKGNLYVKKNSRPSS